MLDPAVPDWVYEEDRFRGNNSKNGETTKRALNNLKVNGTDGSMFPAFAASKLLFDFVDIENAVQDRIFISK